MAQLSGAEIAALVRQLLSPALAAVLDEQQDVDFAFSWRDRRPLRGSAFTQKGETALALRMIPTRIRASRSSVSHPWPGGWRTCREGSAS